MAVNHSPATPASSAEEERLRASRQRREALVAAVGAMQTFKINDVMAFDTSPEDMRWSTLDQAHALCILLSVALDESTDPADGSSNIRPIHLSRSIDAVATLLALSAFAAQARPS